MPLWSRPPRVARRVVVRRCSRRSALVEPLLRSSRLSKRFRRVSLCGWGVLSLVLVREFIFCSLALFRLFFEAKPAVSVSANGAAFITSLGQRPGTYARKQTSAESAIHGGVASIPDITFVILDAVFAQELARGFAAVSLPDGHDLPHRRRGRLLRPRRGRWSQDRRAFGAGCWCPARGGGLLC